MPQSHKLAFYGVGCLLGEEDTLSKATYSCNLRCYSTKGTLYEIRKEHFKMLMHSGESVRAIKETIKSKISHVNCDDLREVLPQITKKVD